MKAKWILLALALCGCGEGASAAFGHSHENLGPHTGEVVTFSGGGVTGHRELELHDDKGDLELWLGEDAGFERPFDLPLDVAIEIEFLDVERRKVTLRARNATTNEDEGGKPNVRDGKTNYFIFPSQDGEDAAWLQGTGFRSNVIVRFSRGGQAFASAKFVSKPHVH